MPPVSEAQRKAACAAMSAKQGQGDPKQLQGAAKSMYEGMTADQLRDLCKSKVQK